MSNPRKHTLKFVITCLEGPGCNVSFEPEGAVIPLQSGDQLRVEITGDDDDGLEISYFPGGIVVGAHWRNAQTLVLDRHGHQLEPRPALPE